MNSPSHAWMIPAALQLYSTAPDAPLPRDSKNDYVEVSDGPWGGVVHSSARAHFEPLAESLEAILRDRGEVLRSGGGQGCTSSRVIGGIPVYCKTYKADNFHRKLRDMLGMSRSRREWKSCMRAVSLGLSVARVIFAGTKREGGRTTHLFISQAAPGVPSSLILHAVAHDDAARESLIQQLHEIGKSHHQIGVSHAHLHAKHILLSRTGEPILIDMENTRFHMPPRASSVRRNIKHLDRSIAKELLRADGKSPAAARAKRKLRKSDSANNRLPADLEQS